MDASQLAYGAVAYLSDGGSSTFVFSKSRVTPLKTDKKMLTIPQAELMAAVIGTRVASSILSAFQPAENFPKRLSLVGQSDRTVLDQKDGKDQVPIRT